MADLELVARHLSAALPDAAPLRAIEPLVGGACQDNFKLLLADGARLVLRSDAPSSLPGSLSRKDELEVIRAATAAGVRTPEAFGGHEGSVHPGRAAYFMRWADGVAIGRQVVASPALAAARAGLADELARELAKIHGVRPRPGLLDGRGPEDPAVSQLAALRSSIDALPAARPALELAYAHLAEHRPAPGEVCLVHGDFRTGNFLVTPGGLSAILDWEFAHYGSPLEDLAWICVRDWRFGVLDKPVGGFADREAFLAAYEAARGVRVDRAALRWWEIAGNLRWAAGARHQGLRYASTGDLELLAIARRAAEMELEALRLIRGGGEPLPAPPFEPRIEPSGEAALEGVARLLEGLELPDPARAFRAKIAAHLARTAALELARVRPPPDPREDALLSRAKTAPLAALDEVLALLSRELEVVSPRFDRRMSW